MCAANMSLGLRQEGVAEAEITRRVDKAAGLLQLDALMSRRPSELSGGQRQRVAIGRAIVREPKLFLFDEPLSNLDAALRVNTRLEIAKLHRQLGATMIYVTHDQIEAMTLADVIVVLNHGIVEQIGAPLELYNAPANRFVAEFLGAPRINVVPARCARRTGRASRHPPGADQPRDRQGRPFRRCHAYRAAWRGNPSLYRSGRGGLIAIRLPGQTEKQIGERVILALDRSRILRFDASVAPSSDPRERRLTDRLPLITLD